MSTRATYGIDGHVFFIPWDGYEAGAAKYFAAAARRPHAGPVGGGFAEQFLRANEDAEITDDHETHGDTEYRYDYLSQRDVLVVAKVSRDRTPDQRPFTAIYGGSLAIFLNRHAPEDGNPWLRAYGKIMQMKSARDKTLGLLARAREQLAHGWSGNASSLFADVERGLKDSGVDPHSLAGDLYDQTKADIDAALAPA